MPADKWQCCLCDAFNIGNQECKEQCCPHEKRCEDCRIISRNRLRLEGRVAASSNVAAELSPAKSPTTARSA